MDGSFLPTARSIFQSEACPTRHGSFLAQGSSVFWATAGGSYELRGAAEITVLLGIFARAKDDESWLDLDLAAQDAGYPGSATSMRAA